MGNDMEVMGSRAEARRRSEKDSRGFVTDANQQPGERRGDGILTFVFLRASFVGFQLDLVR